MNKDVGAPPRSLQDSDDIEPSAAARSLTDLIDGLERASFLRALEVRDACLADLVESASDGRRRSYGFMAAGDHSPAA